MIPIDEAMFATIKEAAMRIGVSQNFLRSRVKADTIPYIYSGNKAFINLPKTIEILREESERHIRQAAETSSEE